MGIQTLQVHWLFHRTMSSVDEASKIMALCFLFEATFSEDLAQLLNSSWGEGFITH